LHRSLNDADAPDGKLRGQREMTGFAPGMAKDAKKTKENKKFFCRFFTSLYLCTIIA